MPAMAKALASMAQLAALAQAAMVVHPAWNITVQSLLGLVIPCE